MPHSQHYHTCNLCKVKNIPCVLIQEQETRHAPDYSKAVIFKGFLIHRECATNLQYVKLKPISLTKALTQEQRSFYHFYFFHQLTKTKKIELLQNLVHRSKLLRQKQSQ